MDVWIKNLAQTSISSAILSFEKTTEVYSLGGKALYRLKNQYVYKTKERIT